MISDEIIGGKLSKREARTLLTLCRKYFPMPPEIIENQKKFFSEQSESWRKQRADDLKKLKELIIIHDLYKKVTDKVDEYMAHWAFLRSDQWNKRYSYKEMVKPERKDNKDYINRGSVGSNRNKIRYPKKSRKTAWKRFYKLFPGLKPKEDGESESESGAAGTGK